MGAAMIDEFDLDIVGALEGTDKSLSVSFAWNYLRHDQIFSPHSRTNLSI
jgi:hypothetical protein